MSEQRLPDEVEKIDSPKVGIDNEGQIVVKNRAYRRRWKTRAELEGRRSKHFYTKSHKNKRKKH